jgi:hypothetical protein
MIGRYFVTSVKGINISDIDDDLLSLYGSDTVPNRAVEIADKVASSGRVTEFYLTEDEAIALKSDPRVYDVEAHPSPDEYEVVECDRDAGDFTRTNWSTNGEPNLKNWGLMRCTAKGNSNYHKVGDSWEHIDHPDEAYKYNSAGDGVDVVIIDRSVQADHPDFLDEYGVSRVQQIEWEDTLTETGWEDTHWSSSTKEYRKPENYYQETVTQHGTDCASIAAGNEYGWAKKAHIYAVNTPHGIMGQPSNGGEIIWYWWARLLHWHKNKGNNRPTVISVSLAVVHSGTFATANITGGRYRGADWTRGEETHEQLTSEYGIEGGQILYHQSWQTALLDELTEAGVHLVFAAGNWKNRIVKQDHIDFDNYWTQPAQNTAGFVNIYYNRGSYFGDDVWSVGALDNEPEDDGKEVIAYYSNRGQGVDLYAPADKCMAATGGNSSMVRTRYDHPDYSSHQISFFSGTSCACPQVAGILACYLSIKPNLSTKDAKSLLLAQADTGSINEGSGDAHENGFMDSNNKVAFMPHNYGTDVTYYNQTLHSVLIGGNWKLDRVLKTMSRSVTPDPYLSNISGYFDGSVIDPSTRIRTDGQYGELDQTNFSPINLYATIKGIFFSYNRAKRETTFTFRVDGGVENNSWEALFLSYNPTFKASWRKYGDYVFRRKDAIWDATTGTWTWVIAGKQYMRYGAEYRIGIV